MPIVAEKALESIARTALEAYDLPSPVTVRLLGLGLNAVYGIHSGDGASPLVLRIHRPGYRTTQNTRSELYFLQQIAERSIDPMTPRPVPARDGRLVVDVRDIETPRHCDLTTWVAGQEYRPGCGLGPRAIQQLGRAIAQVHNVADQLSAAEVEFPRWDADGMFTAASPYNPQLSLDEILAPADRATFDEIADRTRVVYETLAQHPRTFGVIHGDFILGNCYLRRRPGGWAAGIFDFDDCGWGFYLYDLCPMLGNLAGLPGAVFGKVSFSSMRRALLDGYRSVRPFPAEWEAYLPVLMAARHANHCLLTAGPEVSETPVDDAKWRMEMARRCLELAGR